MSERDEWYDLRDFTAARLALGRVGNSLPTRRVLEFQLAHAQARDAVHRQFLPDEVAAALGGLHFVTVRTKSPDRRSYLMNPDLGRSLCEESRARLRRGRFDSVLVIADGLSATAIHAHAAVLGRLILDALPDLAWAPIVIVTGGRVAVGDAIADALGAEMAVVLIGERPGLTATDSLGLYLTFAPQPGITRDADRNCISNIRPGGLELAEATHRLAWLIGKARLLRLTGVALKEDAPDSAILAPHTERGKQP